MKKVFFIPALSLAALTAYSSGGLKLKAYSAVKDFFQVTEQALIFKGQYRETPPEFGQACQLVIDFTQPEKEYLTVKGQYTPVNSVGEGIYFSAADDSFTDFKMRNGKLTIAQKLTDSFSTWTITTLQLSKNGNKVEVSLQQTNSFLFFTDTVQKRCIVTLD